MASTARSKLIVEPTAQWYTTIPPLSAPKPKEKAKSKKSKAVQRPLDTAEPVSASQITSLTTKAAKLYEEEVKAFQSSPSSGSSSSGSEYAFLTKIIQSGTLSDRLSALTLLVQGSPLHNTRALETLRGMAERGKGKGGREESLKALRCIVDWWVGGGAPERKLKYFRDQPLTQPGVTDEHLVLWYFEDWLKKYFFSILQILETLSLDPLPYVRTQALHMIFTLLRDKPEQEQNLLRLLVNKLGDTEKSLCSHASHHLLQLLQVHPSMKSIVVREIVALVLKPTASSSSSSQPSPAQGGTMKHIRFADADDKEKEKEKNKSKEKGTAADGRAPGGTGNPHARYYATITFNQIVLTPGERDIALALIDVYFELFKEILGDFGALSENGEEQNDEGEETMEVLDGARTRVDKKGRVVDGKKGKGKGRANAHEVRGAAGFVEVEDSNSKLISAILTGVNRALPFAKIDVGDVRFNKHIDTLFLITHKSTFNISLQALVLLQQITTSLASSTKSSKPSTASTSTFLTAKSITDRYYRTLYDSLYDPRLATSSKQAMYLNLFFKSVKADAGGVEGDERVKALVRRFVQIIAAGGGGATEFVAGGLYLLGELFSTIPGLRACVTHGRKEGDKTEAYDPRKRDPQFAHASSSPLWELLPLLHHYHPAISLHARQLLLCQPLTASADLSQNTLSHFLDRFVYKNPKKKKAGEDGDGESAEIAKGGSVMQPAASGLDGTGVKLVKGEAGLARGGPVMVNEAEFLKRRIEDVPVDQHFFYKYFSRKKERETARASKPKKKGHGEEEGESGEEEQDSEREDDGSEEGEEGDGKERREGAPEEGSASSDSEEAEIWKAMKATIPKEMGDDDLDLSDDSDDVPSDLDIDDSDEDAADFDDDDGEKDEEEDGSEVNFSLAEDSDNEDLIPLDGGIPVELIEYDGSDAGSESGDGGDEWGGIEGGGGGGGKKRKHRANDGKSSSQKRRKVKSLPTFASYEDYAKMIEDGPEDFI